jgi:hypothetical protein
MDEHAIRVNESFPFLTLTVNNYSSVYNKCNASGTTILLCPSSFYLKVALLVRYPVVPRFKTNEQELLKKYAKS